MLLPVPTMVCDAANASPPANNAIATTSPPARPSILLRLRVRRSLTVFTIRTNTRSGLPIRKSGPASGGRGDAIGVEDRVDVTQARDALLELLGVSDLQHEAVLHHRVLGG